MSTVVLYNLRKLFSGTSEKAAAEQNRVYRGGVHEAAEQRKARSQLDVHDDIDLLL